MCNAKDVPFINSAKKLATNSTCLKYKVGAVIVKNGQILGAGCNHSPIKNEECTKVGCAKNDDMFCRGTHAEINAIVSAASNHSEEEIQGATLYCTLRPCYACAIQLIEVGIKKIIYLQEYEKEQEVFDLLKRAGIEIIKRGE